MDDANTNKNFKDASPRPIPEEDVAGRAAPTASSPSGEGSGLVHRGSRPSLCERCYETFRSAYKYRDTCTSCRARLHWEEGALLPESDWRAYNIYLKREPVDETSEGWEDRLVDEIEAEPPYEWNFSEEKVEEIKTWLLVGWAIECELVQALPDRPRRRDLDRARARAVNRVRDQAVLHLHAQGFSTRRIEAQIGVHHNTARDIVARSGRNPSKGESNPTGRTQMPETIVQRVTALEQRVTELEEVRVKEIERELGLPAGGIKAAEDGLERFLDSLTLEEQMK